MRSAVHVEYFGSIWMAIEVVASVAAGLAAGSFALLAFGGDSVVEFISGVVVLTQLRRGKPGEENATVERIESGLLFALVGTIGLGAAYSFLSGLRPEGSALGLVVAIGAIVIMPYLYVRKRTIGMQTATPALLMDAVASLTCIFMTVALLGGLLLEYFLGLWWADYVATAAILIFVAKEAVDAFRELRSEPRV